MCTAIMGRVCVFVRVHAITCIISHVNFNVAECDQENNLEALKKKDPRLGNMLTHAATRAHTVCSYTHTHTHTHETHKYKFRAGKRGEKEKHGGEDELWALPIVSRGYLKLHITQLQGNHCVCVCLRVYVRTCMWGFFGN